MISLVGRHGGFTFKPMHYFGDLGVACNVRSNDDMSFDVALALRPKAIVLSPGTCSPNQAAILGACFRRGRSSEMPAAALPSKGGLLMRSRSDPLRNIRG